LLYWIALLIKAYSVSTSLESQLGGANLFVIHSVNLDVPSDHLEHFAQPSTVIELPCDSDRKMRGLTDDQKYVIRNLYKVGRKSIKLKSHVNYLSRCLETKIVPKSFKIRKEIPGNQLKNQQRLDKISLEAVLMKKKDNQIFLSQFEVILKN
jgi:hypothetical protein